MIGIIWLWITCMWWMTESGKMFVVETDCYRWTFILLISVIKVAEILNASLHILVTCSWQKVENVCVGRVRSALFHFAGCSVRQQQHQQSRNFKYFKIDSIIFIWCELKDWQKTRDEILDIIQAQSERIRQLEAELLALETEVRNNLNERMNFTILFW